MVHFIPIVNKVGSRRYQLICVGAEKKAISRGLRHRPNLKRLKL